MAGPSLYYGMNALSHNVIMADRKKLKSANGLYLGSTGSGKSFAAKRELINVFLATNDRIIVVDPMGEYAPLVERLGGQVIEIAPDSPNHISPMDVQMDMGGGDSPLSLKADFLLSLCELVVGGRDGLQPIEKTVIDRCVRQVYREMALGLETAKTPLLQDLYEELLRQPEPEAKQIALSLELYTTGSLDIFGHQSNADLDKRVVVFDIHGLRAQLKPTGLLVITDTMLNRVTLNWKKGKRTHVFIDEFHVVFENEFSAQFFNSAWRQFRKRNAYPTAITQNVEYLLDSVQASTMLSNSEFIIMLNQAASDREKLAALLNISPEQTSYITNAPAGCGLLRYGGALVPFKNQFPKDTELYRLMTTKPNEKF
mgnify:CR=1 FL=1